MNLMGLDLSLTSTGFSVGEEIGVITARSTGAQRLSYISNEVLNLTIMHSVTGILIEGYSFASRNSQAHSIGELGGAVRMRLWEAGIPYVDVPPACRAKFATGRGNASKNEVVSAISARTGIIWSGSGSDDKCDAWILEQIGISWLGLSNYDWPKENLSVLNKIDWEPFNNVRHG